MTRACVPAFASLILLAGCTHQPKPEQVILSYSEGAGMCENCPTFKVDFESEGQVRYECRSGCPVPGIQEYSVPAQRFTALLQAFRDEKFVDIPRTDPRVVVDVAVFRLTYRDSRIIHEVVDDFRQNAALTRLENRFRAAIDADRFRKPSVDMYQKLVKSGWNVNTLAMDQQNALTSAAASNDLESVRFLIAQGSTITPAAIGYASIEGNLAVLLLLMPEAAIHADSQRAADAALGAARSSNPEILRYLLDAGVSPNQRKPVDGLTLLLNAIQSNKMANVALLLSRGANPNTADASGRTPLWYAACANNTGFIQLLVWHAAALNAADNEGVTALMNAARGCYYWDVEALLKAGADPSVKNKQGKTAADLIDAPGLSCDTARTLIRNRETGTALPALN